MKASSWKQLSDAKKLALALTVSVVSVVLICILTLSAETLACIRSISLKFLVAAAAAHMLSWLFTALRIRSLSVALGTKISFKEALKAVIAGLFPAAITPTMLGGEPVRAYMLHKSGMSVGNATAVVLSERILDALFFLLTLPFAFAVFFGVLRSGAATSGLQHVLMSVAISVLALTFLAVLVVVIFMLKPETLKKASSSLQNFVKRIIGRAGFENPRQERLLEKAAREIENFKSGLLMLLRHKKSMLEGMFSTVLHWCVDFSTPSLILMGFGASAAYVKLFAAQVIIIILTILPTPGGSGVAEFGALTFFSPFVSVSLLGPLIIGWRLVTYYTNIVVSGVLQYKLLRA
ncbi:MAG: putative membrane flippase AglD2/YbhN [Candidatus Alkanophagales archaeon MCA70_species_1]|nr:putative membrane flippase AglD2/YbhN [Candidatus Alkanophaga volatiphilum]